MTRRIVTTTRAALAALIPVAFAASRRSLAAAQGVPASVFWGRGEVADRYDDVAVFGKSHPHADAVRSDLLSSLA